MKDVKKFRVLLDNGHGENTVGKRSPDGRLREYAYTREIARMVKARLGYHGIQAEILVPENYDVTLEERMARANKICTLQGKENCIFISIHCNAAGSGKWMSARGWSGFIYRGASQNSKDLANFLADATVKQGIKVRNF